MNTLPATMPPASFPSALAYGCKPLKINVFLMPIDNRWLKPTAMNTLPAILPPVSLPSALADGLKTLKMNTFPIR